MAAQWLLHCQVLIYFIIEGHCWALCLLIFVTESKIGSGMAEKEELISNIERIIGNDKLSERDVLQQIKELYDMKMRAIYPTKSALFSELLSKWLNAKRVNDKVISSGFSDLDKLTGGFSLDEVVVVGGRPAMGKTQLMVNFALNISKNVPVLFSAYGFSEQLLITRFLASLADIESRKLAQKSLSQQEWTQLDKEMKLLYEHPLFINSHPPTDINALKAHCIKQIEENHIQVIMIDAIQSLVSDRRHYRNRDSEMNYICKELKELAIEQHVCVIVASNLNRSVEYRSHDCRPQLSDLRDSGAIEQEADKVFFLHRPEYYKIHEDEYGTDLRGIAELIIAKNSGGALGDITLKRTEGFTKFVDFHIPKDLKKIKFPKNRLDEIDETLPF
jgi:replicative DNA helicase